MASTNAPPLSMNEADFDMRSIQGSYGCAQIHLVALDEIPRSTWSRVNLSWEVSTEFGKLMRRQIPTIFAQVIHVWIFVERHTVYCIGIIDACFDILPFWNFKFGEKLASYRGIAFFVSQIVSYSSYFKLLVVTWYILECK